jgi:hypothetical protein
MSVSLFSRSMTNYWAAVSGKGNRIIPIWRPNKKKKGIYHHGPRPISIICHLPGPPFFSLVITFTPMRICNSVAEFTCCSRMFSENGEPVARRAVTHSEHVIPAPHIYCFFYQKHFHFFLNSGWRHDTLFDRRHTVILLG